MAESMANAGGTSRRRVLQAGAAGVGAVALTGLGGALRNDRAVASSGGCPMGGGAAHTPAATFGRIFDDLPPFAANTPHLRQALLEIGAPGGMLDAKDDLFGPGGGPVNLITDPTLSLINKNNPHDTAGMTFVGQFIDHDLTFDATSKLGVTTDPSRSPNSRSARFDLDSVYGGGPIAQSELYDPAHPIKFLLESGGQFEDVPRRADHSAIIGDPRNDSNLIVSGLHAAFLKFHNNAVDEVSTAGAEAIDVFNQARELTVWHYQWLVVNRILPNFVGQSMVDDVLRHGPRYFRTEREPYIPVEFSGCRLPFRPQHGSPVLPGESRGRQRRAVLRADLRLPGCGAGRAESGGDPGDLRGGFRSSRRFIGWQTFFDFGGAYSAQTKPNKQIDTILSTPLFALPTTAIAHITGSPGPISLPQRTLLRHLTWSLPSGQSIARQMNAPVLRRADLADFVVAGQHLDRSTPLWLYVLREAQLASGGQYLGPVGGRIVAEVMIGLLAADPSSYLNRRPRWQPTLGASGGDYQITDFLRFARVDPDSRGQ